MLVKDSYPILPLQHAMLIRSLAAPELGEYVQQLVSVLKEDLHRSAFQRAWKKLVHRHAALRTSFAWQGVDQPVQRVHSDVNVPLEFLDWRNCVDQEKSLEEFLKADRQLGFRLDQAPLMRLTLIRCAEADYRLIWTSHHALFDGRSRRLLLKELFTAYEAIVRGEKIASSEPPSLRSYVEWLQTKSDAESENFWRERFRLRYAGAVFPEAITTRAISVDAQVYARESVRLSVVFTRELVAWAERHELTPNTVLQGAWALLLSRYTGEDGVVFGATRAGRHAPVEGIESMVGLLIHTVPFPVHVPQSSPVVPWLKSLRAEWVAMRDFEHAPLTKIHQWSQMSFDQPLFETLLVFENYQLSEFMRAQGKQWNNRDCFLFGPTHYPLTVAGYLGQSLLLEMTYDQRRFDAATIVRMLNHLQNLLFAIVRDRNHCLSDLSVLSADEERALCAWNATRNDYPAHACIHELFEAQAERTPEAVALVCKERQLTYRELNETANRLAHYLRDLGTGPDELVAICIDRSFEMVIALLATLKAGAAYVPLDSAYPEERLKFMLQDANASVVITDSRSREKLPASRARLICLDRDRDQIRNQSSANLESRSTRDNLAYLIYTSGSTGTPKGVAVSHNGVIRLLFGVDYAQIDGARTFLQGAPVSFDAATFEIWGALLHGGKCILYPGNVPGPHDLGEVLKKHRVDTLWLTAGLFNTIIDEDPQALSLLSQLLIGGESLSVPHVRKALALLPWTEIINGYGPTESTTFACCYRIPREIPESITSIPIGRPIGNTQVYILDAYLRPMPIGCRGELYIGGAGLARGYLNRPELTAERFIPNPFSSDSDDSSLLYKTGDLARYLPDGTIELFGRADNQVKIRGHRIEPGEIESVLSGHPAVKQALVIAREDAPGDRRLAAYIVSARLAPSIRELRSFLREKLPDYMIPGSFVFLEALPLTANGKIDRSALPAPEQGRAESTQSDAGPRTPMEELLAQVWAEVLQIENPGIHENFFELGGHSLLATKVISRLGRAYNKEVPLRFLFESPTVAALAKRIEELGCDGENQSLPPMAASDPQERVPLSYAQQRLWFLDQYEPNTCVYNIPSALRLKGALDIAALERSLDEIVRRHESLRTTFSTVDGEPVQVIAPELRLSLPVKDLTHMSESERQTEAQQRAAEQAREPFDLSRGPLLRVQLLCLGADDHVLILTMHHIVSDGWSRGVFYRELSLLYEAFTHDTPSSFPELPIQYADFAVWQRQWLQGEVLEKQLSYWKKQLEGAPALLDVRADRPRPPGQTYRGASHSIELPDELTRSLRALSTREGVTLFMTLLGSFLTLLYRYTGQTDLVVGSPIANRNRAEIEGLIGFFVNTLVLRTDLSGDPTFQQVLARVRDTALGAYAHQDLPFEKLVEELHPDRSLSHSPLFQVMFNMLESQDNEPRLSGLDVSLFALPPLAAKFDLTLYAIPKPQHLKLVIHYNADLFEQSFIERMLDHLWHLLEAIGSTPDQRITALPLLSEKERHRLLNKWRRLQKDAGEQCCIHHLFEAQVERTPGNIAVTDEQRSVTYKELNRRANQIAHRLSDRGVVPGALIPIFMDRSCDMIAAVFAVLKVGAAYVPLDIDYPRLRIEYMLKDTGAALLITTTGCLERLPPFSGDLLCIDRHDQLPQGELDRNPARAADVAELAYAAYTSGSTGVPKAALISHRGVARYCDFLIKQYRLNESDVVLQLASFSFDASFRDMIAPLLAGAQVVLPDDQGAKDPSVLISKIRKHRATCLLSTVPPVLNALAEALLGETESKADGVRLILVSGEPLYGTLCQKVATAFGEDTLLFNQYGPTECTMTSSYHRTVTSDHSPCAVPIGRPLPHVEFYVLDDELNPTPPGIEGELFIGGDGLAVGYLDRSDQTAEKFIPHPFGDRPGARLYRTGDLVRYRSDGPFVFVGRRDRQVKIRSNRVELGEIEAVLGRHASIREVAVLAREDDPGERRLVAYLVAREEPSAGPALREFLERHVPRYMIPSAFVFLPELPRNPNGKLDRKALPAPDLLQAASGREVIAPRTSTERRLAEICTDLLRLSDIGIHDNFFELGLHSLSATQLVSRVRTRLGVRIPLRHIFEAPTIAGFATVIERLAQDHGAKNSGVDSIRPRERQNARAVRLEACPDQLGFERRPLLSLIAAGKLAPVDAVALSYLSEDFLQRMGLSVETALSEWFDDLPCIFSIYGTHLGRIAVIGLPRLRSEIYEDQSRLVEMILDALEISQRIGGRIVSLTGLIPSATDYGRAIAEAMSGNGDYPPVSTGHATTVSTVVLSIERVLREAGRALTKESVAFLGLGSIGYTTLRLMLQMLPHPKSLTLCDVYSRSGHLRMIRDAVVNELKFVGSLEVVESHGDLPSSIYDASLIVGATNVPHVLDVERLQPGALIVDDSGPHCFTPEQAIRRFESREDILFTAGGVLRLPQPVRRMMYMPQRVQDRMPSAALERMAKFNPFNIGGCVLSGLLTARFEGLKPTIGIVDDASCKAHYQVLQQSDLQAAELHCLGYRLSEEGVLRFRERFGSM